MSDKILISVDEAMAALSLGRSKLLELTYSGELPSIKVGRRRLFPVDGLTAWASGEAATVASGGNSPLGGGNDHLI
ncbi:helix-turn-helix domain-containing protein [SAR202 cluster bacterium AC-647-N09_OGT_505m]|nr:helix-turn-helix domain-containing protein [SAR202 cluster bacterium AC-647-N09_OGT_505m]